MKAFLVLLSILFSTMVHGATSIDADYVIGSKTERNYIKNGGAELAAPGWTCYNDGSALPIDGVGGSSSVTMTRSSSSPIEGKQSWVFTHPASATLGHGCAYPFTIEKSAQAKVLQIEMEYMVGSGTFVAGTASDAIVYIYDVSSGQLIEPSSIRFLSNSTTLTDRFIASFQTSATGTNYKLLIHSNNSTSTAYTLKIDQISISKTSYPTGTPITDWKDYTLTIGGSTSNPTKGTSGHDLARWRRIGDSMQIQYQYYQSVAGTAGSGIYTFSLPSGYTIDANKVKITGDANQSNSGPASGYFGSKAKVGWVLPGDTNTLRVALSDELTNPDLISSTNGPLSGSVVLINFMATVPITGWSSSVQMSADAGDSRAVTGLFRTSTARTINNTNPTIVYETVDKDSHGAYNSSTGEYTIKVPGDYGLTGCFQVAALATSGNFLNAMSAFVNGVQKSFVATHRADSAGALTRTACGAAFLTDLKTGDIVTMRFYADTANTLSAGQPIFNFWSIAKTGGNSVVAASESVNAAYSTLSTTTFSTGVALKYTSKIHDSHNAYNTSTGEYICPISGKYRVTLGTTYVTSGSRNNDLKVAGVTAYTSFHQFQTFRTSGSATANCLAGQAITVVPSEASTAGDTSGFFNIERVGN